MLLRSYGHGGRTPTGIDAVKWEGAGAAGGAGAGIAMLLGSKLMPGAEVVLSWSNYSERVRGADWV
ncbi:MAG: glycerate kinase, partial [Proteobacteria bacterium]|nr:glycerate kinase [Pseudomonadota bacterium]